MDFLFIGALIIGIYLITQRNKRILNSIKDAEFVVVKQCPPHEWKIDHLTKDFICSRCNRSPGSM